MKKLKEIGIGSFRPGREPQGRFIKSIDLAGPSTNADSGISQRMSIPVGVDEDELYDEDEDMILECRVYRKGKYQLLETLDNIQEYPHYAAKFGEMMQKISSSARNRTQNIPENIDENEDEPLDEFSGAAAAGGGPAVPVGYTAKGKPETPAQRRKRQQFNITKSYPYTKLANPPRSSKKRRKKKKII